MTAEMHLLGFFFFFGDDDVPTSRNVVDALSSMLESLLLHVTFEVGRRLV